MPHNSCSAQHDFCNNCNRGYLLLSGGTIQNFTQVKLQSSLKWSFYFFKLSFIYDNYGNIIPAPVVPGLDTAIRFLNHHPVHKCYHNLLELPIWYCSAIHMKELSPGPKKCTLVKTKHTCFLLSLFGKCHQWSTQKITPINYDNQCNLRSTKWQ